MACHPRPGYTVRYIHGLSIAHPVPFVKPLFSPSFFKAAPDRIHTISEGLSRAFLGGYVTPLPLEERVLRPLTK